MTMAANTRLRKGQRIQLTDGRTTTVIKKLGNGGQGTVYRVRIDQTGEEKALKWYFVEKLRAPEGFRRHLARNIASGAPSDSFVWPLQLTEKLNGTFGYIMDIIPKEYIGFPKYLMARAQFSNADAMINAALYIVSAFMALHNKGYNYQDLNDGNFSIHPRSGAVLICDNDNVMGHGQSAGVLGKARYMAPEIVRGEQAPSKMTDRFSLAVILFLLLIGDHPLEGRRTNVPVLTDKYDKRFFGTEPLFIYDAQDASNRPIPGLHRNAIARWEHFPSFMQEAFRQSFSRESLMKGEGRLLDQMWVHVLMRLKSSVAKCPRCGSDMFVESDRRVQCPSCGIPVQAAGYLQFAKRSNIEVTVPIFSGVRLYEYHMDERNEGYVDQVAEVLEKPGKFGLRNKSGRAWQVTAPDGRSGRKSHGDTAILGSGFRIDFSEGCSAEVIANH